MIKIIINFDQVTTTITAAAVDPSSGNLLGAAVLQYKKEAEGPAVDLKHLSQYGNHIEEKAPQIIKSNWGDIIHGGFAEYAAKHGVSGRSAWEVLENTPSGTYNETLSDERIHDLISLAKRSQSNTDPRASH